MVKNIRVSAKVKKLYKENSIEISPVIAGLLSECDRIQDIQDQLWELTKAEPLITEYTNKAGASNLTASAALKELRNWELIFQGACRSIFKILRADLSVEEEEDDGLQDYL